MSAPTHPAPTTAPSPARARPAPDPVPFVRLALVEGRKLVDTRAGRGVLLTIALVTVAAMALVLTTADAADLTWSALATASAVPQAVLLPVLGILAATAEWSQRTGLVTFTLEPRRLRVGAAKLVAVVAVALLAVVGALVLGAVANVIGILGRGGDGSWSLDGSVLLGAVVVQVLGAVQGLAFGAAIGNSAAAIVVVLVLPTLWTVVGAVVPSLAGAARWLDMASSKAALLGGSPTGGDWLRLLTSAAVWILLPLAVGTYRLLHREVN